MSELLDKRLKFTRLLGQLLAWIDERADIQVAIGQDGLKHMAGSLHYIGLAEDLLLYDMDGKYLDGSTPEQVALYKEVGDHWKALDPDCCYGGDFQIVDLDHFSITYQGKK